MTTKQQERAMATARVMAENAAGHISILKTGAQQRAALRAAIEMMQGKLNGMIGKYYE